MNLRWKPVWQEPMRREPVRGTRGAGLIVLLALALLSGCQAQAPAAPAVATPTPLLLTSGAPAARASAAAALTAATPAATAAAPQPAAPAATRTPYPTQEPAAVTPQAPRLMAMGAHAALVLRAAPSAAAPAVVTLPGSDVVWAERRSADAAWLLVRYGETQAQAWAAAADLALFGDAAALTATLPTGEAATASSATPTAAGPALTPGAGLAATTSADQVNLRGGPGTGYPVLRALAAGQALTVAGRSQDGAWLQVSGSDFAGWVAARYLAVTGDVNGLPVSQAPAPPAAPAAPAAAPATAGQAPAAGAAGGKIAFETRSGGDIYLVNANGTGLRKLTTGLDPIFSPDGRQLAFARWEGSNHGIFVIDLASGREQRVATALRPRNPTWSPDGTRLVFSRVLRSFTCYESVFGCLTDQQLRLYFRGQDCIEVPGLGRICQADMPARNMDVTGLTQVTLAGQSLLDLPADETAQSPQWRPGSDEVLYKMSHGLDATAIGQAPRRVVDDQAVSSPAWAPDGQRFVAQVHVHDHADIYRFNAAGGDRAALTARQPLSEKAVNNVAPAWSPDASRVLFLSDRDGAWRLYIMNADGSSQAPFLANALAGISLSYDFAAERMVTWSR